MNQKERRERKERKSVNYQKTDTDRGTVETKSAHLPYLSAHQTSNEKKTRTPHIHSLWFLIFSIFFSFFYILNSTAWFKIFLILILFFNFIFINITWQRAYLNFNVLKFFLKFKEEEENVMIVKNIFF